MGTYCMVCRSQFSTWDKRSRSSFIIFGYNSPFFLPDDRYCITCDLLIWIYFTFSKANENGLTNAYIHYGWDRIALVCRNHFSTWDKHSRNYFIKSQNNSPYECVGVISQHCIRTARVISSYYDISPLLQQKEKYDITCYEPNWR